MVLSWLPETRCSGSNGVADDELPSCDVVAPCVSPSPLKLANFTSSTPWPWPVSTARHSPLSEPHTRHVPSALPVAKIGTRLPASSLPPNGTGGASRARIAEVWPEHRAVGRGVRNSASLAGRGMGWPASAANDQTRAVPSREEVTTVARGPPRGRSPQITAEWPTSTAKHTPLAQSHTRPSASSEPVTAIPRWSALSAGFWPATKAQQVTPPIE
mmetsp:Transcript_39479/g.70765  ORF Transcript_39479/g.70765 Transcript_39479/m.70765 type:complete len:215 (-) Transcript_39479:1271-1915(-)